MPIKDSDFDFAVGDFTVKRWIRELNPKKQIIRERFPTY